MWSLACHLLCDLEQMTWLLITSMDLFVALENLQSERWLFSHKVLTTPRIKKRSLFSLPLNVGWPCNFLWPLNAAKVIFWDFQAQALRELATSASSLSKRRCHTEFRTDSLDHERLLGHFKPTELPDGCNGRSHSADTTRTGRTANRSTEPNQPQNCEKQ